jgi:acetylornithine deacetylase/succinyl-diaminopimelate desuccinylase-like protein
VPPAPRSAADEVVDLCRALIQTDTTNFGDGSGPGERAAAELVAGWLDEVGLAPTLVESAPGRTFVVARVDGADPARSDALLLHGHLDVVPADPKVWRYDPFAAEVADGCIWGRGAVDMKDMDAMIIAVVRERLRTGRLPARPLVLCFLPDEEAGGVFGSHWLVDHRPDLVEGCTQAVSEVGGFSITLDGPSATSDVDERRAYLLQTAEKGIAWLTVEARGTEGHGSLPHPDNAVSTLARALARVADHEWPTLVTPTMRECIDRLGDALGVPLDVSNPAALRARLGTVGRLLHAATRNSANPTVLRAGRKTNQVPAVAQAHIDGRFVPGQQDAFVAEVDRLLGPDVHRIDSYVDLALEVPFTGGLVEAMEAALLESDPGALVVPYTLFGGTDAKAFSLLGIAGYGFAPLRLPPDLDFPAMFHGVDERVPVDALTFGVGVLDRFLDLC